MDVKFLEFKVNTNNNGTLVAIEEINDVPFIVRRVYYMHDLDSADNRGCHAHRKFTQVAICIQGKCKCLLDDGENKKTVELEGSNKGILLEKMVWHEMFDFSVGSIILVLADAKYDESDYIRDYQEFKQEKLANK